AYHDSKSPADFRKAFDGIMLPKETKAKLWDAKFSHYTPSRENVPPAPKEDNGPSVRAGQIETLGDMGREMNNMKGAAARKAVKTLPTIGGITGAALGEGMLSVPFAMLGGAAGESAKQLIERGIGDKDVPKTSTEAAKEIGGEAAVQGINELTGK